MVSKTTDREPSPAGCRCTWEFGDSACPVHPTCNDCGQPPPCGCESSCGHCGPIVGGVHWSDCPSAPSPYPAALPPDPRDAELATLRQRVAEQDATIATLTEALDAIRLATRGYAGAASIACYTAQQALAKVKKEG